MKKTLSLLIAFLMIFSCVAAPVYAENLPITKSAVNDVLNKTHGEGYYDAGGASKFETQGDWLISRAGDWTCYDISALSAGLYSFSISAGANSIYAKISVEIDGNKIITKKALQNTGSYTTMKDQALGKITIPAGAQKIKFINDSTHAFFFESFTLTKIMPPEISSFTTNTGVDGGVVSWGADVFTLTMAAAVETTSVSEATVMIKDENDTALSADVSAEGNIVTLKLNESLKPGSSYSLYAVNLAGTEGQVLTTPSVKNFSTSDSSTAEGTAYIEVLSYSKEENTIMADGVVKSSFAKGINGRNVYLKIKDPNGAESTVATVTTETKDGKNGHFSITYTIPDDYDKAGKHQVFVTSDCVTDVFEETFTYYTEEIEAEITQAFSGLTTTQDAESALSGYIDYLGMTQAEFEQLVPDPAALYDMMLDRTYETASDAISAVKNNIFTVAIMQADDKDDIISILDDEEKVASITGFNKTFWDALLADGKDNVATSALDFETDVVANLNDAISAELMSQEEITKAEIDFNQATVQSGEKAEIKATLRNEISDVYSFTLNFEYDQNSGDLFKDAEITAPEGFGYEVSNENGVYSVKVTAVQDSADAVKTNAISGDILTLKLKSSSKLIGTHELDANGLVLYHPEVISDKAVHLDDELEICSTPAVTITEVEKLVVDIQNPVNFLDNPDAGGSNIGGVELADKCIVSRRGEWTEYDISALSEGEYEVAFFYGSVSDVKFDVLIDGNAPFVLNTLKGTGSYSTYKSAIMGRATVDGNQRLFRISNTGGTAAYVGSITFTKINPLKIEKIYANDVLINNETNKIYRGTDRIKVEFNNELDKETANENNVTLTDENDKKIDCLINSNKNVLLIDLKETLIAEKDYTLTISNLKDRFTQVIERPYSEIITTYPADNDEGFAGIDIETCKVSENELVLKGTVLTSSAIGIKGRTIKVFAKGEEESQYTLFAEGVSGKDGAFELSYIFDENKDSGKYSLNIYVEYGETPFEKEVYYFDATLSAQVANDFSNLPDGAAVEGKFIIYSEDLGIDYEQVKNELDDISFVTNKMANKAYETATEVKDDFLALVVLEKINQAADSDAVVAVVDDVRVFSDAGEIQRDKWDALEDAEQKTVAENARKDGRIEKVEDLLSIINKEINKVLQEKYELEETNISVSAQNINVGQGEVLTFTSAEKQENVVGIHIEIAYSESEKALLGTEPILTLSKYLKDLDVKVTYLADRTVYDLTVKQSGKIGDKISKVSFLNEMLSLSYTAAEGSEGSYSPEISGYISYHTETAEDKQSAEYFADVPFVISANPTFTVSRAAGSDNYEGGGGFPGGNLGLGGGNQKEETITPPTVIPPTTTEGLNTLPFNDIENVSWAKDAICALAEKGIISGKDNKTFAPNDNVTRAEFCKMIALAFNLVDEKATCDFDDVAKDAWYYTYIAGAKAAGVINGREDNTFSPEATITREEMATIAMRATNEGAKNITEKFADDSSISDFARDAVYTLKELGIINGVGENMFSPKAVVTRAMAAKVIYMLITV